MEWIFHSYRLCRSFLVLLLFAGLGLPACSMVQKPATPQESSAYRASELKALDEGMQAFHNGDFEKARVVFEALTETAQSEGLKRKAFFALASTRLIQAQTPEEFNEAMSVWLCWNRQVADQLDEEDPRMLTPFLQRLTPPGTQETQTTQSPTPVKKIIVYNPSICKDVVQGKEKEIERIKAKLEAREKEIRRLKHQIDSLEAIHLKYQERKQGASSP